MIYNNVSDAIANATIYTIYRTSIKLKLILSPSTIITKSTGIIKPQFN